MERSRLLRGMWGWFCITSMPRRASAARRPAALWGTDSEQRRFPSRGVLLDDAVALRCVHDCRSQPCAPCSAPDRDTTRWRSADVLPVMRGDVPCPWVGLLEVPGNEGIFPPHTLRTR